MRRIVLDFETFWSVQHSLTKINPILYVLHPETEIQSVSITVDDELPVTIFGENEMRAYFSMLPWHDAIVGGHNNSGFDALIAAWRFGIRPKMWACTLAMARPIHGLTVGLSLQKLSEVEGLPPKLSLEEVGTKGLKLAQFTTEMRDKMKKYNPRDTLNCRELFNRWAPRLGKHELKLIDMTIRMTTEPQLLADIPLLEDALQRELARKRDGLLELATVTGVWQNGMEAWQAAEAMKPIVMSQPQFAALLEQLGAVVPLKESGTQVDEDGEPLLIPALSKKDKGMEELLEHDDYRVSMAAAVRLETKSTQLETRLRTFIDVANAMNGWLPVPINYSGAFITWRMSGAMKMNMQNLPRVNPKHPKPSDALRSAIIAPEGKLICPVDSSNIELRVAHMLAGQHDTIERLNRGEDLYCWFATNLYGRVVTKADIGERFIGKQAMLSLQYGSSWKAFQNMCRVMGKAQGLPPEICLVPDDECKRIVKVWRAMFPAITDRKQGIWVRCEHALCDMFEGREYSIDDRGLCVTGQGRIITPNGHWLSYPALRKVMNNASKKPEWRYGEKQHDTRIYGAHLFENLCQHLARLVVMEQTLKIHQKLAPVALSCHDEAVTVPDEDRAEHVKQMSVEIFSTPPKWWPDLPVAAEADLGISYADAK